LIVPTSRTVRLFAATMLPAALALALAPESRLLLAAGCLLLFAVWAGDALLAERRRSGVRVEFPERLNLSRDQQGGIPFTVCDLAGAACSLVIVLPLPEAFSSPARMLPVELGKGQKGVRVQWPLTGTRRGDYLVEQCRLRVRSPLGLWYAQGSLPAGTKLRVYPNLRQERKSLAELLLNRNNALVRPQRQVGQGREFEKLRLYLPGDSLGDIHWRATAKRGHLVTKEFRIERTQEVYVIIDASRLSSRMTDPQGAKGSAEPLLERYIRSALILGGVAQKQGDLFGVMAFSDRVLGFVRAKSGKEHFGACRDALYGLASGSANPGYDEAVSFLATRLKRRALLIFLTSLDEAALAEGFVQSIRVLSRRHLVCVAMPRPAAAAPLFSKEAVHLVDDVYRSLGGHLVWHGMRELQQSLRLRGVQLSLVEEDRLSGEVVAKYLDAKRRQLL
jgi:uncharacterized protein (DUF58 family)